MDEVLEVVGDLTIPLAELDWRFGTSGGPGGQHANTSHTRAEVRFDIAGSPSLTDAQRRRLSARFGPELRVSSSTSRSQARNRAEALERLATLLADALATRRRRVATRPTRTATVERLAAKRRRSDLKQARRPPGDHD